MSLLDDILGVFGLERRKPKKRTVTLHVVGVTVKNKHERKYMAKLELSLSVKQFARYRLVPRDSEGSLVNLDKGALVAEKLTGPEDALTEIFERIEQVEEVEGGPAVATRVFYVDFVPGAAEGVQNFKVSGDAQPGTGIVPIEQEFEVTGVAATAANLNPSLVTTGKKAERLPPAGDEAP